MGHKNGKQERLIAARARSLAVMYLTRRSDLLVKETTEDVGIDLMVRLVRGTKAGLRQLGVEIRGVWERVTKEQADKVLRCSFPGILEYGPFPFPVCLFFYTMRVEQAWFTWIAEPVVDDSGRSTLRHHKTADCRLLDDQVIAEIVAAVDRWYDAFYGNVVAEEPKRKVGKA